MTKCLYNQLLTIKLADWLTAINVFLYCVLLAYFSVHKENEPNYILATLVTAVAQDGHGLTCVCNCRYESKT
jgi:hypothetical protein